MFNNDDPNSRESGSEKIILLIALFVAGIIIVGFSIYLLKFSKTPFFKRTVVNKNPIATTIPIKIEELTKEPPKLPTKETGEETGKNASTTSEEERIELLSFGKYYTSMESGGGGMKVAMPINVKKDVANYYDIARIINLDKYIDNLNANGFALIKNPQPDEIRNFYNSYDYLTKKNLPLLITSDFIFYFYNNQLKQYFNDIKRDIFFARVWDVNKKLFVIADQRYRERKNENKSEGDPVLEAARLEAAYFATTLELLMPKIKQVNGDKEFIEEKFTQLASSEYRFDIPDYLKEYVKKETDLIYEAKKTERSPIFLYSRDYKNFKIPNDVKDKPKLANFFLATKWLNSEFPLYYKTEVEPNNLLDYEDWVINFTAANLIANDFNSNQEIKNNWAIIYKVISYFQGLRGGLTYLHYLGAAKNMFGENYKVNEVIVGDMSLLEENLEKLRGNLSEKKFLNVDGAFSSEDVKTKSLLGLRVLQDSYWPNEYIFKSLITPSVTKFMGEKSDLKSTTTKNVVNCLVKTTDTRCRGISLDLVGLLTTVPENDEFFRMNTNYEGYSEQSGNLSSEINQFNEYNWRSNIFWTGMSIGKKALEFNPTEGGDWWLRNKNVFLGNWVNLQLPFDNLAYKWQSGNTLTGGEVNSSNFIEPNEGYINDIYASTKMLKDALFNLKVIGEKDLALVRLKDMEADLEKISAIIKKENIGEKLEYEDLKFISTFAGRFENKNDTGKKPKASSVIINAGKPAMVENIEGVNLMAYVYENDGKKIMAVGPVFNYYEK